MRPLSYAILACFKNKNKHSALSIFEELKNTYHNHPNFELNYILESLMIAKENGLINEVDYEINNEDLIIFYQADQVQIATLNKYL